jgi:polysaccharide export outer membrane protein
MKWIHFLQRSAATFSALLAVFSMVIVTGCETTNTVSFDHDRYQELLKMQRGEMARSGAFTMREGDTVRITFPGAPNLNTVQLVRRDGKIEMPLLGELQAAGLGPLELEQEILKRYGSQLLSKEVTVTIESATYDVFVTGAVVKPGKVVAIRPITAIEAIMESGGPDYTKANLKDVTVVRQENGRTKNYRLNIQEVLNGKRTDAFFLKPSDIIYVREKFNWF